MTSSKERMPRENRIITLDNGKMAIEVSRRNGETVHYTIDKKDVAKVRQHLWFCHTGYCCAMKDNEFWYLTRELLGRPGKGYVLYTIGSVKPTKEEIEELIKTIKRGV